MKDRLVQLIAAEVGLPKAIIEDIVYFAKTSVKHIKIPKRNGGTRTIYQPDKRTKLIQYWLISRVYCRLPIHHCASAYSQGSSIKDNAIRHQNGRYILKLDFKDFFPSIKYNDLDKIIKSWHRAEGINWSLDSSAKEIINNTCFYKEGRLPIGYPSSPIISNVVMYKFDAAVVRLLEKNKGDFGACVYSRYADDIIVSASKKGATLRVQHSIEDLIARWSSPTLTLNTSKTRNISISGGSAIVTGLRICHDHHITVRRQYKDHVRLMLTLYLKGKLDGKETQKLIGHLHYIKNVAPLFLTKLNLKYSSEISRLLNINSF